MAAQFTRDLERSQPALHIPDPIPGKHSATQQALGVLTEHLKFAEEEAGRQVVGQASKEIRQVYDEAQPFVQAMDESLDEVARRTAEFNVAGASFLDDAVLDDTEKQALFDMEKDILRLREGVAQGVVYSNEYVAKINQIEMRFAQRFPHLAARISAFGSSVKETLGSEFAAVGGEARLKAVGDPNNFVLEALRDGMANIVKTRTEYELAYRAGGLDPETAQRRASQRLALEQEAAMAANRLTLGEASFSQLETSARTFTDTFVAKTSQLFLANQDQLPQEALLAQVARFEQEANANLNLMIRNHEQRTGSRINSKQLQDLRDTVNRAGSFLRSMAEHVDGRKMFKLMAKERNFRNIYAVASRVDKIVGDWIANSPDPMKAAVDWTLMVDSLGSDKNQQILLDKLVNTDNVPERVVRAAQRVANDPDLRFELIGDAITAYREDAPLPEVGTQSPLDALSFENSKPLFYNKLDRTHVPTINTAAAMYRKAFSHDSAYLLTPQARRNIQEIPEIQDAVRNTLFARIANLEAGQVAPKLPEGHSVEIREDGVRTVAPATPLDPTSPSIRDLNYERHVNYLLEVAKILKDTDLDFRIKNAVRTTATRTEDVTNLEVGPDGRIKIKGQ